jgi:hypothetical protein
MYRFENLPALALQAKGSLLLRRRLYVVLEGRRGHLAARKAIVEPMIGQITQARAASAATGIVGARSARS